MILFTCFIVVVFHQTKRCWK